MTGAPSNDAALLDPISGVTLRAYAEINVEFAQERYDTSKAISIAAARGISSTSWREAVEGWNQRIRTFPEVAEEFDRLYGAITAGR